MGRIYSEAQRVYSWLGKTEEASEGIDMINRIVKNIEKEHRCETMTRDIRLALNPRPDGVDHDSVRVALRYFHLNDGVPEASTGQYVVRTSPLFSRFFTLIYWKRLWILQEVALAREVVLCCAKGKTSWSHVSIVSFWLRTFKSRLEAVDSDPLLTGWPIDAEVYETPMAAIDAVKSTRHRVSHFSLDLELYADLGYYAIHYQATNPRDYVYGMMGITEFSIDVDYSLQKTVAQIYQDYVAHWLHIYSARSRNTLAWFLEIAGIGSGWKRTPELPSWAPDFAGAAEYSPRNPSDGLIPRISPSDPGPGRGTSRLEGSVLRCAATIVGHITEISPVIIQPDQPPPHNTAESDKWMIWMFEHATREGGLVKEGKAKLYDTFRDLFGKDVLKVNQPLSMVFELLSAEVEFVYSRRPGMTRSDFFRRLQTPMPPTTLPDELTDPEKRYLNCFVEAWTRIPEAERASGSASGCVFALKKVRRKYHNLWMAATSWDQVGLFPRFVGPGDVICTIEDLGVLIVLRKRIDDGYVLVGTCYLQGLTMQETQERIRNGLATTWDIAIY